MSTGRIKSANLARVRLSLKASLCPTLLNWQLKQTIVSSAAQSCPTLCDPMNHSTPGLPVHHQLWEFTQTHVHRVGDAIQPSYPLSSPSPAPNPSQHQGLFQRVNSSHEVARVLEFQLQHQSFQWTPSAGSRYGGSSAGSRYGGSRPWRGHEENTGQARPSGTPSKTRSLGKNLTGKAI